MSMKFLTGLQDLLGMYDAAVPAVPDTAGVHAGPSSSSTPLLPSPSSVAAPSHLQQLQSPSIPIPPIFTRDQPVLRKRSAHELNRVDAVKKDEEPIRRCSHTRTVHFPDDDTLVTGYHEAPKSTFVTLLADGTNSPSFSPVAPDPEEISLEYRKACRNFNTRPIQTVLNQIKCFHRVPNVRQESLVLKGERVNLDQMEALEAIFQRVQFEALDLEYTFLDDETTITLGEMVEFYDATHKLNLSFNKNINSRGWQQIFKAVKNCSALNVLNLRYTSLCEKSIPHLSKVLRAQPAIALSTLHLENTALSGKNLLLLVCALKANHTVKELYMGENSQQPSDGAYLYQLIIANTTLQLLDIRNNSLQDGGLRHICDALRHADTRAKSQLNALVLWNNKLTGPAIESLATALIANPRIETLNIGCNKLGLDGALAVKKIIQSPGCTMSRLGLQSTALDCVAAIELAECIAENATLMRVDLRDNPSIVSAGLMAIHSAMKMNKTITLINLDVSVSTASTRSLIPLSPSYSTLSLLPSYQPNKKHEKNLAEFKFIYDEIREFCIRNRNLALGSMDAHVEEDGHGAMNGREGHEGGSGDIHMENHTEGAIHFRGRPEGEAKEENSSPSSSSSPSTSTSNGIIEESTTRKVHKFTRSSSLTCSETCEDIHERIREMSNSTSSLDESNAESQRTIKKVTSTIPENSTLVIGSLPSIVGGELCRKAEWSSLPSLVADGEGPSHVTQSPSTSSAPVIRKMRRFSVSPTTSSFDLGPTTKAFVTFTAGVPHHPRPLSLDLFSPPKGASADSSPSSAPIEPQSAPALLSPEWNPFSNIHSPATERFRVSMSSSLASEEEKIQKDVGSVVTDLINYIVYEEQSVVERKKSMLLTTVAPPPRLPSPSRWEEEGKRSGSTTPLTPSRMTLVAEELSSRLEVEEDALVVRSLLHDICRKVVKAEKLAEIKKAAS